MADDGGEFVELGGGGGLRRFYTEIPAPAAGGRQALAARLVGFAAARALAPDSPFVVVAAHPGGFYSFYENGFADGDARASEVALMADDVRANLVIARFAAARPFGKKGDPGVDR